MPQSLPLQWKERKPFELYGNLLSDEARQPWKKIIQARRTKYQWEDNYGVTHDETPTKTWDLLGVHHILPTAGVQT